MSAARPTIMGLRAALRALLGAAPLGAALLGAGVLGLAAPALAETPVGPALRPWTVDDVRLVDEELAKSFLAHDDSTVFDRARGVLRDTSDLFPSGGNVWVRADDNDQPRVHYTYEKDGEEEEEIWPPSTSGALDWLGTWDGPDARLVVARARSSVLLIWSFRRGVLPGCQLDTGQLSHDDPASFRMVVRANGSRGASTYFVPVRPDGTVDPVRPGFVVLVSAPELPDAYGNAYVPSTCEAAFIRADRTVPLESGFTTRVARPHPTLSLGASTAVEAGTAGTRADLWAEAQLSYAVLGAGFQAGALGPSGGLAARAGLRVPDPHGHWEMGLLVRAHDQLGDPVPGGWGGVQRHLGRRGLFTASTELLLGQPSVFGSGVLLEQDVGLGLRVDLAEREVTVAAVGGAGVDGDGLGAAWAGVRVTGTNRFFAAPDWRRRAARLAAKRAEEP